MGILAKKLENFAPDIVSTVRRFPLPILFLAIVTALVIAITNEFLSAKDDFWPLMALGFFSAAIFATAGRLFNESHKFNISLVIILELIIPLGVVAIMHIKTFTWFVPFFLPIIGIFWLSVSPFTKFGKGAERKEIQDRFWIVNHRAVVSAIIAFVAFLVITLGLVAIERSLSLLFSLKVSNIFYEYLLPISGMFLAPVFWLSTIGNLDEIDAKELEKPDFISKAIGFLGQFLFVPFLIAYALILLAYAVQIVITQTLPVGTLGWMVLGFTMTGIIAWLMVYPNFMRKRQMVRLFRSIWFWLTIIPLMLFFTGVYIRIDAYGFTSERMVLLAGGVWALLLTLVFLFKPLRDIRLMPLFAGLIFLSLSITPFNIYNGPLLNQSSRLENAIFSAIPSTSSTFANPEWSDENAKKAIGAIDYLYKNDEAGEILLEEIFKKNGLEYKASNSLRQIYEQLGIDNINKKNHNINYRSLRSKRNNYSDVSATPFYLGKVIIGKTSSTPKLVGSLGFKILPQAIKVSSGNEKENIINLADWLKGQKNGILTQPEIDFTIDNIKYRLIVETASLDKESSDEWKMIRMEAVLFASKKSKIE